MIRVLHCGLSDSRGGIESFLLNLARGVDPNEISFGYIAYGDTPACEKELIDLGGQIYRVPSRKTPISFVSAVKRILLEDKYDILHIHKNSPTDILPFIAGSKLNGIKIIAHAHNTAGHYPGKHLIINTIGRYFIIRKTDKMLACSKKAAAWLFGDKVAQEADRVEIIPNGIDLNAYRYNRITREKVRRKLQLGNSLVLGCVGRFVPQKNQAYIIDIMSKLIEMGIDVKTLFIGDGNLRKDVEEKAIKAGLMNKCSFIGEVNSVIPFLQAMDIFVMPSLYEGLPISAIEAQAASLPCVISDNVTSEIEVTKLIKRVPVDKEMKYWINAILEERNHNRSVKINNDRLIKYDSKNLCHILSNIYMKLV